MQTTVQDHGRMSYRAFGVPKSGPMDAGSARKANLLVGNPDFNPVLEFTLQGPVIELLGQGYIAVTGGVFDLKLNQQSIPQNQAIELKGKNKLAIGSAQLGCRGYIAVAGEWLLSPWLESCSTAPQNTAQLTPDSLIQKGSEISIKSMVRDLLEFDIPATSAPSGVIRILAGPEYHLIDTDSIKELFKTTFTISSQSNRMGYRLNAPLSRYQEPVDIISSAVVPGTIQLTNSGQLIILMADAQTTGGYPRIANVVSADLDVLGQMKPGDQIRFQLVSLKHVFQ